MSERVVRQARPDDLAAVTEIYNHYVIHSEATFDLEPFEPEARRPWFESFAADGPHQLFVVEEAGRVRGYAYSGRFRAKPAYDASVETTIYLAPNAGGRGLGTALYSALFTALSKTSAHRAFAGIVPPNPASEALHRRFGFEPLGVFREAGHKFGRYWDVAWFQKGVEKG
ncbi:MAG: N-acetyltransferase family protein [Proteobacteria bacterium]|nr:N-acetyltransferase family protein [Pseudomonadota bacterium]